MALSKRSTDKKHEGLRELSTLDDLDAVVAQSEDRPVVILKHSRTCGRSVMAVNDVSTLVPDGRLPEVDLVMVDVRNRAVTNAVAARFGVRHESPQALLIREGTVRWHASHWGVTADAVIRAVREAGAGNPQPD